MEKSLIEENLKRILFDIEEAALQAGRDPGEVRLMAVTKTVPAQRVNQAIACGVTLLGENRAQELNEKYDDYNRDGVDIHFIGHLQTNKVRQVVGKVTTIQSVDSLKLAREISKLSVQRQVTTNLLMEINIGGELSKGGVEPEAAEDLAREIATLPGVFLQGLMSIPPICENSCEIEGYFSRMRQLLVDIQGKNIDNISMDILSMGMSGDYREAVKHGSSIVRIGSAIFGSRGYPV